MSNQIGILTYKPIWFIIKFERWYITMEYQRYKKAYFCLFCAMCDTIELWENILTEIDISNETKKLLTAESERLKAMQQLTEEIIISDQK